MRQLWRSVWLVLLVWPVSSVFADNQATSCATTAKNGGVPQAIQWYRDSTEKVALYYQIFASGGRYIHHWVNLHHPKPYSWGVVLDIDETALDNSWYFAKHCSAAVTNNNDDYDRYVVLAKRSIASPGVVALTHYVHQLGGYVTLLSNRNDSATVNATAVLQATIDNLAQQNIYFDQVLLANGKQSKNPDNKAPRFKALNSGIYDDSQMIYNKKLPPHQVIAYFGDHMHDFPIPPQQKMSANCQPCFAKFGNGYFILPNPMYG